MIIKVNLFKWIKAIGLIATCILLLVFNIKADFQDISWRSNFGYFVLGILVSFVPRSLEDLKDNQKWKISQRKRERANILNKDTKVRISFAYLFRIKVDDKYLLIPNSRTHMFQPVGGAYKFGNTEREFLHDEFSAEDDDCIPVDETTRNDYRLNIKNKFLRDFVKRFNKTSDRENIQDLSREFKEELIETEILDRNIFKEISYRFIGRHMTDITTTSFKDNELLLADIVELKLTKKQEDYLRSIKSEDSEKYYFASSSEIINEGIKLGSNDLKDRIANHSYKILIENTDKLMMRGEFNNYTICL